MTEHKDDCDKLEDYTDGLFWTCWCGAVAMNTIVGAHYKHRRTNKEPVMRLVFKAKEGN